MFGTDNPIRSVKAVPALAQKESTSEGQCLVRTFSTQAGSLATAEKSPPIQTPNGATDSVSGACCFRMSFILVREISTVML